jgi:hypothetical protein
VFVTRSGPNDHDSRLNLKDIESQKTKTLISSLFGINRCACVCVCVHISASMNKKYSVEVRKGQGSQPGRQVA